MPAFCPLCAADEHTHEGTTEDGVRFAVCRAPDHGTDGFVWEPSPPPGSPSVGRTGGLGAELGAWEKLWECVPEGVDFVAYGVIEDRFLERFPLEARQLLERYGHRWRHDAPRSSTHYSMSVYLSARLRELATEGLLDVRWGPAEGDWSYNGQISYWRRHTESEGELRTMLRQPPVPPSPVAPDSRQRESNDIARIIAAASTLPPAEQDYTEDDFVMNLFETVLDYQLHTTAVVNALEHYRTRLWDDLRTIDDVEAVMASFDDDRHGNTALAQHLWGYRLWTRAHQLRDLVAFFRSVGVGDQPALERWAERAEFERDFQGKVKGLGPAVFQWLVMRQGIDTVKPDVHVHRFITAAIGRTASDTEVIELVTRAAAEMRIPARELDWRIWEASRRR